MKHFYPGELSPPISPATVEARLKAQEFVLQCLCKAISSIDGRSGHAMALALEVAEMEQAEMAGPDDEIVRFLRSMREACEALPAARVI
jgi:hypothetical protein